MLAFTFYFISYGTHHNDDFLILLLSIVKTINPMIPIFLYVTIKIIRFAQTKFMTSKNKNLNFHSNNVNEELGRVEYILVERSGTITKEELFIESCMVKDTFYTNLEVKSKILDNEILIDDSIISRGKYSDGNDIRSLNDILSFLSMKKELSNSTVNQDSLYHFIICMTICNRVYKTKSAKSVFVSAHERIMVETSKFIGITLVEMNENQCVVNILGNYVEFQLIAFRDSKTSFKKRIIVLDEKSDQVILYVKGKKDEMQDLYDLSPNIKAVIQDNLNTLDVAYKCNIFMGCKILTKNEFESFLFQYKNAKLCPINSDGKIESIFCEFETGLEYLGFCTIDDKIKKSTKETVSLLTQSGIKLWLMSGEDEDLTMSSAINSNLINRNSPLVRLTDYVTQLECTVDMSDHIRTQILNKSEFSPLITQQTKFKKDVNKPSRIFQVQSLNIIERRSYIALATSIPSVDHFPIRRRKSRRISIKQIHPIVAQFAKITIDSKLNEYFDHQAVEFNLLIDTIAIEFALANEDNRKLFCVLLSAARCVIFHSLKSSDKTKIARLLKNNFSYNPTFLSIGDITSSAGMIKKASVGVGIIGKKGIWASNAAHFSVKKFSDLKDLVLVDGFLNYIRISNVIVIYLYVNFTASLLSGYYCFVEGSSGLKILKPEYELYYFGILCSIPLVIIGIFDEKISSKQIYKFPQIYSFSLRNDNFSCKRLL